MRTMSTAKPYEFTNTVYDEFTAKQDWTTDEYKSEVTIYEATSHEETAPYSPRKQGAGVINVTNALSSKVYLEGLEVKSDGTYSSNPNGFGKIELRNNDLVKNGTLNFKVRAHNETNSSIKYNVKFSLMTPQLTSYHTNEDEEPNYGGNEAQFEGAKVSSSYDSYQIMNLDKWRERRISSEAVDFAKSNRDRLKWPDQDTINFVCWDDKIVLPAKYGVLVPFFIDRMFISEHMSDMDELMDRPKIVHYAGYQPWIYPQDKSMHSGLWWKTWRSLHAFPKVMSGYSVHFLKYILKMSLIRLGIIRRGSRAYCCDMYWYHSKVRMADVRKLMEEIKGII